MGSHLEWIKKDEFGPYIPTNTKESMLGPINYYILSVWTELKYLKNNLPFIIFNRHQSIPV